MIGDEGGRAVRSARIWSTRWRGATKGSKQVGQEEGAGYQFGAIEDGIARNAQDGEEHGEDAFDGEFEEFDEAGDGEAEQDGEEFRAQAGCGGRASGRSRALRPESGSGRGGEAEGGHCGSMIADRRLHDLRIPDPGGLRFRESAIVDQRSSMHQLASAGWAVSGTLKVSFVFGADGDVSPSLMLPRRISSASGSSRKRSTARRIGRAP